MVPIADTSDTAVALAVGDNRRRGGEGGQGGEKGGGSSEVGVVLLSSEVGVALLSLEGGVGLLSLEGGVVLLSLLSQRRRRPDKASSKIPFMVTTI